MLRLIQNKFYTLEKTAICLFPIILFGIVLIFAQALNLTSGNEKYNVEFRNNIEYQSSNFIKFNSCPIHPISHKTFWALKDTESTEEDETNENIKKQQKHYSPNFYFDFTSIIFGEKGVYHQLILSIQNRSTVALFILYHSWKSSLLNLI